MHIFDRRLFSIRRARLIRQSACADFLLDHVAAEIGDRLAATNREFENGIAYNACGGALAEAIRACGKVRFVVPADAAPGMGGRPGPSLVYDEEAAPFAGERLGLVASALTLHFANDLPGALVQVRRALRPDGLFLAALFAGDTLHELRDALVHAEAEVTGGAAPRVAPFADVRDLGALLQRAGFALPVVDTDRLTVRYDTAFALIADLRAMGQTNAMAQRPSRSLTRQVAARMAEIYHARHAHDDGRIPATFQIAFLTGWAPHDSQPRPLRPGSAQRRLADALGTREHKLED
jgi:SAM-dependent methyltransferase